MDKTVGQPIELSGAAQYHRTQRHTAIKESIFCLQEAQDHSRIPTGSLSCFNSSSFDQTSVALQRVVA